MREEEVFGSGVEGEAKAEEWEERAREWLLKMPKRRNVTTDEMDGWIHSNISIIPHHLLSNSRFHLYGRIISFHKIIRRSSPSSSPYEASDDTQITQDDFPKRPFQRTEQWAPVYLWLESLEMDAVVKSKSINEWLSQNPSVKDRLFATHSSYQLMHYIRKCHARILRKRGKLRKVMPILEHPNAITPLNVVDVGAVPLAGVPSKTTISVKSAAITPIMNPNTAVIPLEVEAPSNTGTYFRNFPSDNDLASSRKSEALLRYEILTDLQNQLTGILSRHRKGHDLKVTASTVLHRHGSSA